MYTDEELNLIWQELDFLCHFTKMSTPDVYLAAEDGKGGYKTAAKAIALDAFYTERQYSNILTVNRKLYTDGYISLFSNLHPSLKYCGGANSDYTKIRYYQNKDKYETHADFNFMFLAMTYFYREPKEFKGGSLLFPEHDYEFECENNSMILIPGYVDHAVSEVEVTEKLFEGKSRFCMTQFGRCG
jgi:Rps23 Pro-64 3,4-dihydroxylase Tpa1-like proline 4-hydroxylase